MRHYIFVILIFSCLMQKSRLYAQSDTGILPDSPYAYKRVAGFIKEDPYHLTVKKMLIPAALITYGVFSVSNHMVDNLNISTRHEISEHQPGKISADNYTQYVPAAMVYALNAAGIKGEHNFADRTIILASSQLISAAIVLPLKYSVKKERPDGSNEHSFPSGHTATAFSTAHFMYREYRKTNFLLSISGYPLAIFTGVYRTLNNKHWVGDVVAGAGIGILSTEIAYWLQPKISGLLKNKKTNVSVGFAPYISNGSFGLGMIKKL